MNWGLELGFGGWGVGVWGGGGGLGFGVWGLGFGVWDWGLGFGVWGFGFGVWGLGFGVLGFGFRFQGLGFRVECFRSTWLGGNGTTLMWVQDSGFRIECSGLRVYTKSSTVFNVKCLIFWVDLAWWKRHDPHVVLPVLRMVPG